MKYKAVDDWQLDISDMIVNAEKMCKSWNEGIVEFTERIGAVAIAKSKLTSQEFSNVFTTLISVGAFMEKNRLFKVNKNKNLQKIEDIAKLINAKIKKEESSYVG